MRGLLSVAKLGESLLHKVFTPPAPPGHPPRKRGGQGIYRKSNSSINRNLKFSGFLFTLGVMFGIIKDNNTFGDEKMLLSNTYAKIDLDAIRENFQNIKKNQVII